MNYLIQERHELTDRKTGRYLKAGAPNGSKWTDDVNAAIRYSNLADATYTATHWCRVFKREETFTAARVISEQGDLAPEGTVDAWL